MSDESEAPEAAPPKSKKKLFVIVGVLVLLLAGGGGAAWYFMGRTDAPEHAKEEPPKPPVYLPLETFTVNLHDSEQFLQVDLTLQVTDQAEVDAIKLHMPRVRSRLLTLLASKDAEELLAPQGKVKLVKEIVAQINQPFDPKGKPQKVQDVLFTSFVIQ